MAPVTPSDLQRELDAIFDEGRGARDAEPFLMGALAEAERVGDRAMMLTVQNELAGLYRAFSRHEEAVAAAESALALIDDLGADGSDVHATTLINAATAQRAAGDHDGALARYRRALAISESTMAPTDRRLAALHNNLSMVYSETGDDARARDELRAALAILEATTTEPDGDIDVATTLTNLGLVELSLGEGAEARVHLDEAVAALRRSGFQSNAHYASALAGAAQARFRGGEYPEAVDLYTEAAELLARIYGTDNDYYRVTAQNLDEAREAASVRGASAQPASPRGGDRRESAQPAPPAPPPEGATAEKAGPAPSGTMSGLELAREYWNAYGPALLERYPALRGRVAAGLVGHGSDCYGFDDDLSRDHDFGPGFCLWLTAEDYADHGAALQADYDALPEEFAGVGPRTTSPRATGTARRVGVFEIGGFYREITGYADAPDSLHEWLMLEGGDPRGGDQRGDLRRSAWGVQQGAGRLQAHAEGCAPRADLPAVGNDGSGRAVQRAADARSWAGGGGVAGDR